MKTEITEASIGAAMREARRDAGYTIKQLSDLSGVDDGTLATNERGKYMPGLMNLIRLADALGLPLDDYIGRKIP